MDSSTDPGARRGAAAVPLRVETHEGAPALHVPRWSRPARAGAAVLLGLAVLAAAGAVAALVAGPWLLAVLLGVVALALVLLVLRDRGRTPYDGGVWLSPSGLSHQWGGRTWSVPWDDLVETRHDPGSGDVVVGSRRGGAVEELVLSTHLLVVPVPLLLTLVATYRDRPDRRRDLGTESHLLDVERLRAGYAAGFRPVVHRAPSASPALLLGAAVVLLGLLLGLVVLGRATAIDDDDLADSVARQLGSSGADVRAVECEGSLRREVGESQRCTVEEADGLRRAVTVTVTAVDGDRTSFRLGEG